MRGIFCFMLLLQAPVANGSESQVSAKTMEVQDKVLDAVFEQSTAQMNLEIAEISHEQLVSDCAFVKDMVRLGHMNQADLNLCQRDLALAVSRIYQHKSSLKTLERNAAIWTERLKGERGEVMDTRKLSELYHEKWVTLKDLLNSQVDAAKHSADIATQHRIWAERQRSKGYITELEFAKIQISERSAYLEVKNLELKSQQIEHALVLTSQDLNDAGN